MPSFQAQNLLTLAACLHGESGVSIPDAAIRMAYRNTKRLAGQIIAGDYPVLRNVMEPDPQDEADNAWLVDGDDEVYYEHYVNGYTSAVYGTGVDEDDAQPEAEFGDGVYEYVDWFSDGEDSRYESDTIPAPHSTWIDPKARRVMTYI